MFCLFSIIARRKGWDLKTKENSFKQLEFNLMNIESMSMENLKTFHIFKRWWLDLFKVI
jgi:hypothetical protein